MASAYVTLDVDGSRMKTWVAVPDGPGPFPGVIVSQHAGGMDTFIRSICDRLADAGFAAAAPDLYHRQDGMTFEELDAMAQDDSERWPTMMAKTGQTNDDDIEQDVRASMAHLGSLLQVGSAPIGIMGFCGGGRVSYLMAARIAELAASVVFHGGFITMAREDRPAALDVTSQISCPLAGFFGLDDQNPSPEHVAEIAAELDKHEKSREFHSYADTGHSFLDHTNPRAYREASAADAWEKAVAFFNAHLKVPA
jgi:carboxymethylenebutenolidase